MLEFLPYYHPRELLPYVRRQNQVDLVEDCLDEFEREDIWEEMVSAVMSDQIEFARLLMSWIYKQYRYAYASCRKQAVVAFLSAMLHTFSANADRLKAGYRLALSFISTYYGGQELCGSVLEQVSDKTREMITNAQLDIINGS